MNISAYRRRPSATKETPACKAIESIPKVTASQTRQHNPRKQSSKKVLKVRKHHYLYNVSDPMIWNGHIDESVFALSFQENVVVFNESKDKRQHRSSVLACVYSTPNDTGVGIVSVYLLSGSTTTFLKISDETGSTLSFCLLIISLRSLSDWTN